MVESGLHQKHAIGMFSARKEIGKLRTIFDTRIASSIFCEPPAVRFPTAVCYLNLEVLEAAQLPCADGDVKDTLYHRELPRWLQSHIILHPIRAPLAWCYKHQRQPRQQRHFNFATVACGAMGWSYSDYFTQKALVSQ